MTCSGLSAHAEQKYLCFFVLFLFRYPDDFRDHSSNIAYSSTNIVVIRPMRDRGLIVDIDIVLNIQCTESTIALAKMNRPENIFMVCRAEA